MFLLPYMRDVLMGVLPKGGHGAEIGVDRGVFSQVLLDDKGAESLLLVDPWVHQTRDDYQADPTNESDAVMQARCDSVMQKYADDDRVCIWRSESLTAAANTEPFRAGFEAPLDWVYIDAVHSYEGCIADLQAWSKVVKPDGLIMGHDFASHAMAQQSGVGVMQAVYEFITATDWELFALTNEAWATYVLCRDPDMQKQLMECFVTTAPALVEIRDARKMNIGQVLVPITGRDRNSGVGFLAANGQPVSIMTIEARDA